MRAKPASPVCARRTSPSTRPSRRVSSLSGRSLSIAMSISGRLLRAPKPCISGGRLLGCSARLTSTARHANAEYMSSVPDSIAQIASVMRRERIADLFARDPARVEQLTFAWHDWRVDVAKERISHDALAALLAHAEVLNLPHWIAALFSGEKVNLSEARPALHTALRQQGDAPIVVDGRDVIPAVRATQSRMRQLSDDVRLGRRRGATGKPIRALVNLGIGGSDLGPRLVMRSIAAARRHASRGRIRLERRSGATVARRSPRSIRKRRCSSSRRRRSRRRRRSPMRLPRAPGSRPR